MDPHKILGVDKDASPDEIRRAYRKKASQYHPDKGGDVWIFQQIQDAYDELTGNKKKKRKKPKSQASGGQPETPNRQYQNADPFGFDVPDPQPTYQHSQWQNKHKKKKANVPWLPVAGVAVAALLLIAVFVYASITMLGGKSNEQLANVEVGVVDNPASAEDVSPVNKADELSANKENLRKKTEDQLSKQINEDSTSKTSDSLAMSNSVVETREIPSRSNSSNSSPAVIQPDRELEVDEKTDESSLATSNSEVSDFVPLFNERNLNNWFFASNPVGPVKKTFSIKPNGVLSASGTGFASLWSENLYSDFVLELEWRLLKGRQKTPGGSGIYIRSDGQEGSVLPDTYIEVQISEEESGDLYVNPLNVLKSKAGYQDKSRPRIHRRFRDAAAPTGDWNKYRIVCEGNKLEVSLNGVLVNSATDIQVESGRIGLFFQGNDVDFRKIKLSNIDSNRRMASRGSEDQIVDEHLAADIAQNRDSEFTDADEIQGFVELFNGENLDGWEQAERSWEVRDGNIYYVSERGDLETVDEFEDFELNLEFLLPKGSNGGIFIPGGFEVQLVDDQFVQETIQKLKRLRKTFSPKWRCGAVHDVIAPTSVPYRGAYTWNDLDIVIQDRVISITMNGERVIDKKRLPKKTPDNSRKIKIQGHKGVGKSFRNIRIRRLDDSSTLTKEINNPTNRQSEDRDQTHSSEFVSLFNGSSLQDWSGDSRYWTVENGAITGRTRRQTKGNTFLIWENGMVSDFLLKLKFKIDSGNSGVQFRSEDQGNFVVAGYQADIDAGHKFTGILYDEKGGRGILANRMSDVTINVDGKKNVNNIFKNEIRLLRSLKDNEWNTLEIYASGNEIEQKINGITTVRVVDKQRGKAKKPGILALQLHGGPPMKVQFKDILLKEIASD